MKRPARGTLLASRCVLNPHGLFLDYVNCRRARILLFPARVPKSCNLCGRLLDGRKRRRRRISDPPLCRIPGFLLALWAGSIMKTAVLRTPRLAAGGFFSAPDVPLTPCHLLPSPDKVSPLTFYSRCSVILLYCRSRQYVQLLKDLKLGSLRAVMRA
jgi:hypothetical protein